VEIVNSRQGDRASPRKLQQVRRRYASTDRDRVRPLPEGEVDNLIRLAETAAAVNAVLAIDVFLVWANHVLRHIAPAILRPYFVRMIRIPKFTRDVHRFAAEMNTGNTTDRTLFVVVLFKWHD
jgi:hypothetical protein